MSGTRRKRPRLHGIPKNSRSENGIICGGSVAIANIMLKWLRRRLNQGDRRSFLHITPQVANAVTSNVYLLCGLKRVGIYCRSSVVSFPSILPHVLQAGQQLQHGHRHGGHHLGQGKEKGKAHKFLSRLQLRP
jgi:hypothetical protein